MNESSPRVDRSPRRWLLQPGDHLLEVTFLRPVTPDVLQAALQKIGFEQVVLDQSLTATKAETPPTDRRDDWSDPEEDAVVRYRFVARLPEEVTLEDNEHVRWSFAHKLRFDPYDGLAGALEHAYELLNEESYEVRFIARRTFQDKHVVREKAWEALRSMGFVVHKLSCLHRDMRLPNAMSVALWIGIVTWKGPKALIHEEDPLFFEDLTIIPSEQDEPIEERKVS